PTIEVGRRTHVRFGPKRTSRTTTGQNAYRKDSPHRIALNPLPVEAAFSAGGLVVANRRRAHLSDQTGKMDSAAAAYCNSPADSRRAEACCQFGRPNCLGEKRSRRRSQSCHRG